MTTLKGYTKAFDGDAAKSDTVDLTKPCQALYIGVAGDVKVILAGDTVAQVFKAVPVGVLQVSPRRIFSTGTAATNILGLATN